MFIISSVQIHCSIKKLFVSHSDQQPVLTQCLPQWVVGSNQATQQALRTKAVSYVCFPIFNIKAKERRKEWNVMTLLREVDFLFFVWLVVYFDQCFGAAHTHILVKFAFLKFFLHIFSKTLMLKLRGKGFILYIFFQVNVYIAKSQNVLYNFSATSTQKGNRFVIPFELWHFWRLSSRKNYCQSTKVQLNSEHVIVNEHRETTR